MKETIPHIHFKYSPIYNTIIGKKEYKSQKVSKYIHAIQTKRSPIETSILSAMNTITELKRHEPKIICYIAHTTPFSDPLTIAMYPDIDMAIDTLTHECIHQLFTQWNNIKKSQNARKYFFDIYKDKDRKTIIHIPLHAIHAYIYTHILKQPEKIDKEYERIQKHYNPKYKQAYLDSRDIVRKEWYQHIIDIFHSKDKRIPPKTDT